MNKYGVKELKSNTLKQVFSLIQFEDEITKILLLEIVDQIELMKLKRTDDELEILLEFKGADNFTLTYDDVLKVLSGKPSFKKMYDKFNNKDNPFKKLVLYNKTKINMKFKSPSSVNFKGLKPVDIFINSEYGEKPFVEFSVPFTPIDVDLKFPLLNIDFSRVRNPLVIEYSLFGVSINFDLD